MKDSKHPEKCPSSGVVCDLHKFEDGRTNNVYRCYLFSRVCHYVQPMGFLLALCNFRELPSVP